ncbi:MAG: type VI secretion system membrane subunit TssM [Azoarcus sp.]|jgi:type VI secretion system protein ImpL|nr:type VI secretion system membrane subunit TssM [Azoarcus sp.]
MKFRPKNAKMASALGFLILIALVWFAGPFFGLTDEGLRLKIVFGVMAAWVLTLLIGQLFAARAGRLLEKMLRRQADEAVVGASPSRRAEIKLLRERLLAAIHTLKTSKLGKARGQAAIYEMPWYLIMGHPAAGKTTALVQSGLTFPFSDQHGASVQGIGGTRNCDWFFSTEGVLLDTAGRYSTEAEDRQEWLGFLKLLKRYRSKAPVNGILIATSLPELVRYREEDFTVYARQIRERIHEIGDVFGLRPPVYLVFTKLDLLGGFAQFFEDADEDERARVWGATLDHEQNPAFDARRAVDEQCELLYRGLRRIGEEKLGLARGADARPALYVFPLEFHALKDGVTRFVELLDEDDPYHTKPFLRGVYFTSAVQKGEPGIAAAVRVSGQFDLERAGFEPVQTAAAYGYFLRDLFRGVLFADQYLIQRQSRPRAGRLRLAGMAAGLTAALGATSLLAWSYNGNNELIASAGAVRAEARTRFESDTLADKLAALTRLQQQIEQLRQTRVAGVPLRLGAGLYAGNRLEAALRGQYFDALRAVMLEPVRAELESTLKRSAQAPRQSAANANGERPEENEGYQALKTYLMLASRPRLDAAWLSERLPRDWRPWLESQYISLDAEGAGEDAARALAFYLAQLAAPDLPLIGNDETLIDPARKALLASLEQQPATDRVYAELRTRANAKFPPLTVARILNGKDAGILEGKNDVPGAFTREAWEKYMREAIIEASRGEIASEDWVLSVTTTENLGQESDTGQNRNALESLYRADYAAAWMAFLAGLTAPGPKDIGHAESVLARLADPQSSPIRLVLQRTAFETAWDNPAPLTNTVAGARQTVVERANVLFRGDTRLPNALTEAPQYGPLGRRFASFATLIGAERQPSAAMNGYLEQMGKLKARFAKIAVAEEPSLGARELLEATLSGEGSEILETMRYVDEAMFVGIEPAFRESLQSMLEKPLLQCYAVLLPPVEEDLELLWDSEVLESWREIAHKFPFGNASGEASFGEINRFLKPGDGTLAAFVDTTLDGLVALRGNRIEPLLWRGRGVRFNPAFLASAERLLSLGALLGGDAFESSRFELQPVPTPGLSEITIEIDGQSLRYRMGPQLWQKFRWPGGDEEGARIQAVAFDGATATVSEQSGRMGLVRMFNQSKRALDARMTSGQLVWRIENLGEAKEVKFNFRMVSGLNPMRLSALNRLTLPARIVR